MGIPLLGEVGVLVAALMGQTPQGPAVDAGGSGPSTAEKPAIAVAAAEDLSALSIDALIKRLPPAGSEWRWDRSASRGVEDPASLEMATRMSKDSPLTDAQWRAVLTETGAIRFRERWPKDEDYIVSMTVPRWLGVTQIRITPRAKGMEQISAGEVMMGFSGTMPMIRARDARQGQSLGKIPEGTKEIVFDVEVERGSSMMDRIRDDKEPKRPKPGIIWKGTLTVPVQLVASFDEAVPGVEGEAIDKAVRDAFGAGFRKWADDPKVPYLVIDPDGAKFPALETTGLDIKAELVRHGKVVAESWLIAMDADRLMVASSLSKAKTKFYGTTNFKVDEIPADTSEWSVRLTGSSEHVWCLWSAKQRWKGTITIPWDEAAAHEKTRVGVDGRGPEASTPHMR